MSILSPTAVLVAQLVVVAVLVAFTIRSALRREWATSAMLIVGTALVLTAPWLIRHTDIPPDPGPGLVPACCSPNA